MKEQQNTFSLLNISVFLQTQTFMFPVLLLFYQHCGLSVGDFFLFQGIFSLSALLLEVPMGYLADIFPKKNILILSYFFVIIRALLWLLFARYGYWILLFGEILYAAYKTSFSGTPDSYIYEYLKSHHIPHKMVKHYGKMNFFVCLGTALSSVIGTSVYAFVSQYSIKKYNYDYGFIVLISLELFLNLTAVLLLLFLPKIPPQNNHNKTLKNTYKKISDCTVWIMKNENIKYHILYSGLLVAGTAIFSWSFQPIMKLLLFPVSLYGLVYFINHMFRAFGALYLNKISQIISLTQMGILIFLLFIVCFISTFIILNLPPQPIEIRLIFFIFLSFTIAGQVAFTLRHTCRLHTFIPSDMRATSSSVNTMIGRLYAGFFFILMKILLDGISIQKSLGICFICFIIAVIPLKKFIRYNKKQEDNI